MCVYVCVISDHLTKLLIAYCLLQIIQFLDAETVIIWKNIAVVHKNNKLTIHCLKTMRSQVKLL